MSLTPKINEIRHFVSQYNPDFIFITETWLRESVEDNQVTLPGYNVQRQDRSSGDHGGVCLYLNEGIKFNILRDIEDSNSEVLWVQTRPARLPKGIPCIIAATIYHPPSASNNIMLEYLSKTLTTVEGLFPGCGIILAGDFNHLDIKIISCQFQLKHLVHLPTRGTNTLDLVLTNLHSFYLSMSQCCTHPSDFLTIVL